MKDRKPVNLRRSAKAPVTRSGVMAANMHWKDANKTPGIEGAWGREALHPMFLKRK